MAAEREGGGSSIPAPSPVKRLFIGVKQPNGKNSSSSSSSTSNPNLDRYPLRLRTPDLSNCHVCGSQINPNNNNNNKKKGNKDNFRTLDSQWRIVIICNCCYTNLQSAKYCSYCFSEMSAELGVCCHCCNRCVHRECLPMYGSLNNLCSNLNSFTCIDCWVPRSINRKRIGGRNCSSASTKDNFRSLEDAAEDAKSKAEMKRADAAKTREMALEKAAAAKRAAEIAADALDLANEKSQVDGFCPVIDDAELALRLHRAINSSRRIFKNVESVEPNNMVKKGDFKLNGCSLSARSGPVSQTCESFLKKKSDPKLNGCSLSERSDLGSRNVSVLEAGNDVLKCEKSDKSDSDSSMVNADCSLSPHSDLGSQIISVLEPRTDHLTCERFDKAASELEPRTDHLTCERFDKAASEPSLQIGTMDNGSSSDLGTLDHKAKESRETSGACRRNDKPSSLINCRRVLDDGHVETSDNEGWILALPAKEKQAKCSSKVTISSGNHARIESVSRCIHRGVLTYKRGTRFRSSYSVDLSLLQNKSDKGPAMFLRKYSRRHHGAKMYIRKYCRRQTNSKHISDHSTSFSAKTFHLKSETSGTVQMKKTEVLTSTETSFQSPHVP